MVEGSAAGQLRLMTAQHHAQQHQPPPPPQQAPLSSPAVTPPIINPAQRNTLSNVTNNSALGRVGTGLQGERDMQSVSTNPAVVGPCGKSPYTQTAARVAAVLAKSAAGTQVPQQQPRAQFYGHNPNLKVPQDMCLLGCVFLIVEYDRLLGSEVQMWTRVIIENGGEIELNYTSRLTHIVCMTQKHPLVYQGLRDGKRCVTAEWLNDVCIKQQVLPPWLALHFPTPFGDEKPCRHLLISYSGFEGDDRLRVKRMIETVGAKVTQYYSAHNNILVCRRPEGEKYKKARELQKSVVNVQWLNEIIFGHYSCLQQVDSQKYQQFNLGNPFRIDYALVPHLMSAWKVPITVMQESYERIKSNPPIAHRRKRPRLASTVTLYPPTNCYFYDPEQENKELVMDVEVTNPNPPPPEKRPTILFSMIYKDVKEEYKKVYQLGGVVVKSHRNATHLVLNDLNTSLKFLCSCSTVKYIVSINWLNESHSCNTFLDEEPYIMSNTEIEKKHNFSIKHLLSVPRSSRRELFKDKTFFLTPGVVPGRNALREIIECAGGKVDRQRRSLKNMLDMEPLSYFVICEGNDNHLVADVMRSSLGVYPVEFVLVSILRQRLEHEAYVKRIPPKK